MRDWFTQARSSATRMHANVVQGTYMRPGLSPISRAIAFAIISTILILALLIIIPLVLFAGLAFLVTLIFIKVRQAISAGLQRILPRNDGRSNNIRVRVPAETGE